MWNKIFKRARIVKKHETCYVLTITYSYYWLYDFDEVFVECTLDAIKNQFLKQRARDHISFTVDTNTETLQNPFEEKVEALP